MLVFDIFVLVLIALSSVYGLIEGFLHQLSKFFSWFFSLFLAWKYSFILKPSLFSITDNDIILTWVSRSIIFLIVMVFFSFATKIVSYITKGSALGPTNRVLGFIFGAVRGFVIVFVIFIVIKMFPTMQLPSWFVETTSYEILNDVYYSSINPFGK